jgi:hypothetical protein
MSQKNKVKRCQKNYRAIEVFGSLRQTAQASAKVAPNTGEISEKEYPTGRGLAFAPPYLNSSRKSHYANAKPSVL